MPGDPVEFECSQGELCFDPKQAAATLAQDLNKMTVGERNLIFDDVHGVRSLNPEQSLPSNILWSLEQMKQALEGIRRKDAYSLAVTLGSPYVLQDKLFRIRFLWADEFHPQKAAQRFVNYLDFAHNLFGHIALMRPIYFDDLSKEEQNILREGSIQLLPFRDRAERRILIRIGSMGGPNEGQYSPAVMRVNLYMMQVLASDEKTQQYGCVMIFHSGHFSKEDGEYDTEMGFLRQEANLGEKVKRFIAAFPVRVGAVHLCFPRSLKYRLAAAALSLISPVVFRVRLRTHIGTQAECRYALASYGIPGDQLPITSSGRIKMVNHQRWIKFQRGKEDSIQMGLPSFEGIDCPLGMDILIGNNTSFYFKNNPGSFLYNELLQKYSGEYDAAMETQEKTRLTWQVLGEFSQQGGRLLARDKRGWWSVAQSSKAREKIAHDFRELRKKKAASANATASAASNATNDTQSKMNSKKRKSPVESVEVAAEGQESEGEETQM